ncbi:MAG: CYTH and CHAD domain-containing protein [Acidithiobacillus ferriphilus]
MKQELKFRLLDPDAWGALLSHPLLDLHALSPVPMDAVYFDTADGALHRAGIAYHVRREGERWIATVQGVGTSAGGLHQRPEWTVVVEGDKPSPQVFAGTEAGMMLSAAVGENILLPLLETHFQRFERELSWEDGSGILIAADRGEIRAGDARAPILELDLKLLHGHPGALLELGSILARDLPLLPDPQSRIHRGLALAGLIADNQGCSSLACPLRHRDVAGDALVRLLVTQCQRALGDLSRHLAEPMDATCFHDLRKDVRALRSFLRLAEPLDPQKHLGSWRQKLALWFHAQGPRRDRDVLAIRWAEVCAMLGEQSSLLQSYLAGGAARGTDTETPFLGSLLLGLWAALSRHGLAGEVSLQEFTERSCARWDAAIQRARKKEEDPAALHALRIRIKNLRYALAVLTPVWPSRDSKALLKTLITLQDILGEIHDTDAAAATLHDTIVSRKSRLAYEAGILIGWLHAGRARHIREFRKIWERFLAAPRPWG